MLKFKSNSATTERETAKAEEGDSRFLWQRIRAGDDYVALCDPQGSVTLELGEASDAVRDAFACEEENLAQVANAAFGASHAGLMQAIAGSRESERARRRTVPFWRPTATWPMTLQRVVAACMLLVAVATGGHALGHKAARILPVESLVDEFDASLRSATPFELVNDDPRSTADWLRQRTGMRVSLPAHGTAGVKLVGARGHTLWGRKVAQTQYLKNDTRVALYQIRAPRCGLPALQEVQWHGRTFFVHNAGGYRAIIWRSDENVMAVVSPFATREAVLLADAIRSDSESTQA